MRLGLSNLAVTASLLASATNLVAQEIPLDLPVSTLLSSAQSHLARGETSEALAYYDAAVAKDPSNYLTFFKRATTYLSLGRPSQASQDFGKVLELKPGFEGAHVQLAKIKAKVADWKGARSEYVAANKSDGSTELIELTEAEGAAALSATAEKDEKWEECVSQTGAAILVASRAIHLRERRAHCRFERGEVEQGIADLHHVLQLRPGNTDPHILISATTFYGLGDLDNGISQIRKCLHSDPDSKVCQVLHKQEKRVQKALSKAENQLNRGQTTTAGRALAGSADEPGLLPSIREQIDKLRQDGWIPTQARTRLYDKVVEMVCQAYSEVRWTINLTPYQSRFLHNGLPLICIPQLSLYMPTFPISALQSCVQHIEHILTSLAQSNHKDASKYCEEAVELDPESFWGLVYRGKSLLRREEYEAAIQTLEKAAELRPDKSDKVNPILHKAQIALKRSKTKDYYKVLGVANDADERQIKSAYRKASKQYHPDKAAKQGIIKEEAEKKMASINEAYEILSNPELRARFDQGDDPNSQEGGNPFQGSPFGGGHPFMFQQGAGGANFKFHFPGGGGGGGSGPFGF
jgi:DnaJ family protein C protein 3